MNKLYCVFFMFHQTVFEIREVEPNTTAYTVKVPRDTQFFVFVEADCKATVDENIYYARSPHDDAWEFEFSLTIPVLYDTYYVIGGPSFIDDAHDIGPFFKQDVSIREIIPQEKVCYEELTTKSLRNSTYYETSHFDTFFNAKVKVVLEWDGTLYAITDDGFGEEISDVFGDFYGLCLKIDTVAREFPELYDEIIRFIDERQHVYFERLARYCRCQRAIAEFKEA